MIERAPALPPPSPRGLFHRLRVALLEEVAEDALAVTFAVPPALCERFRFHAGQHLTVRLWLDGREERRSYSICSPALGGPPRVGVRRLPGGLVSTRIHRELKVGDELEVMEPAGSFTLGPGPADGRSLVALAAGSGITPVLSLVATELATSPRSTFTVVYGNRSVASAMFLEELAGLKNRYPGRLQLQLVFSRELQAVEVQNGRVDGSKLRRLAPTWVPAVEVERWFICGPHAMVVDLREALADLGVPPAAVRTELFYVEAEPPARTAAEASELARPGDVQVSARLNGRQTVFRAPRSQALVDGLAAVRADAPFSCKGGVCATCRARLLVGRVAMDHEYALDAADRRLGYILTCQAHPLTDRIVVDYDG